MKPNATGIAFDGKSISWTRLERGRAAAGPNDSGVFADVPHAASFDDPAKFEAALDAFGRRVEARAPETCTLALPTRDLIFRCVRFPSSDPAEVAAMAMNQVEKDSPLPIEEMVGGFEILEQTQDATLALCAAAPLRAVELARRAAGADPARIERVDAVALGLLRGLADSREGAPSPAARDIVLAEEGGAVTLIVADAGQPVLVRSAGEAANVSRADLTRVARIALIQAGAEQGPMPLGRLIVVGGEDGLRTAATAVAAAVGCQAVIPARVSLPSASHGVALRTMEGRGLNLFPAEWRSRLSERKFRKTFRVGIAAAAAVWVLLAGYLFGWPALLDQRVKALEAEVARLAPDEAKVDDIRTRIKIIERYSDRSFSALEALLEISTCLPQGIELAAYRYNGAKRQVAVEGRAGMSTLVYDFMDNLKRSPIFGANKLVSGPTLNRNLGVNVFELAIDFKSAETSGEAAP